MRLRDEVTPDELVAAVALALGARVPAKKAAARTSADRMRDLRARRRGESDAPRPSQVTVRDGESDGGDAAGDAGGIQGGIPLQIVKGSDKDREIIGSNLMDSDATGDARDGESDECDASHVTPALSLVTPSVARAAKSPRASKTLLPDDWMPKPIHVARARREHQDLDQQAERFRLHAKANGRRMVDWDAAFTTWLIKAKEFAPAMARGRGPLQPNLPGGPTGFEGFKKVE